jgi:anti-sigma B factor antagonist
MRCSADRRLTQFNENLCLAEMMNVTDPQQEPFRAIVDVRANTAVVVAEGELDVATAPQLEAVLRSQSGPVVVDLRPLRFIDAAGLRVLLAADQRSRQNGNDVSFIPGEATRRLAHAAGVGLGG